jgi:type II secretory ATPase GspE/PulE/Tfp pilus assembly ATPase PilB-like protein
MIDRAHNPKDLEQRKAADAQEAKIAREAAIASLTTSTAFQLDAEPISLRNGVLTVGLVRDDKAVIDRLKVESRAKGVNVELKTIEEIRKALNIAYPREQMPTDEASTRRIFQMIVDEAVRLHATDVLIEPSNRNGDGQVRLGIDGLFEPSKAYGTLSQAMFSRLVGLIRTSADVAPNNPNLEGKGRYTMRAEGRELDLRISTLPIGNHQRVCIRFLSNILTLRTLEELGMSPQLYKKFSEGTARPGACVTIAGPTGQGKSTSAYAAIIGLDRKRLNICSIENPIECYIDGCMQIPIAVDERQASREGQLTFAGASRALLRQNPHFVFLGEIQDEETAAIAMSASTTGIALLSTVHAYDALRTIIRLETLGLNRAQIAQSMTMATSQRLLRRLCDKCKISTTKISKKGMDVANIFKVKFHGPIYKANPNGCDNCRHRGYADRVGAFEVLEFSPAVRDALESKAPVGTIAHIAVEEGFRPMVVSALEHIAAGLTDETELNLVLSYDDALAYVGSRSGSPAPTPLSRIA